MAEENIPKIKILKIEISKLLKDIDDLKYRNCVLNDENKVLKIDIKLSKDKVEEIKNKWSDALAKTIQQKSYIKELLTDNERLNNNLKSIEDNIFKGISINDKREENLLSIIREKDEQIKDLSSQNTLKVVKDEVVKDEVVKDEVVNEVVKDEVVKDEVVNENIKDEVVNENIKDEVSKSWWSLW